MTNLNTSITTLNTQIQTGTTGMVIQNGGSGGQLTVGATTGGASISMAGTAGARVATGIADGNIAVGSQDAVTGNQLNSTNTRVSATEKSITKVQGTVDDQGKRLTTVEGTVATHSGQLGQMQQDLAKQGAATDQRFAAVETRTSALESKTRQLSGGVAAAMAMKAPVVEKGKTVALGLGLATYDGRQAIGAGITGVIAKNVTLDAGASVPLSGGPAGGRVGGTVSW